MSSLIEVKKRVSSSVSATGDTSVSDATVICGQGKCAKTKTDFIQQENLRRNIDTKFDTSMARALS